MTHDIFDRYGFKDIDDSTSLNSDTVAPEWTRVSSKNILDFDGFETEYVWYTDGNMHIFMFGDSDLYEPDVDYADHVCESEREAQEWFDSYTGAEFDDCDTDLMETESLTEAYTNLPKWFTDFLDHHSEGKSVKRVLTNRGIDLANATYTRGVFPRSNRDPVLKDPSRLTIFRLKDYRNNPIIYIVGVNDPWIHHSATATWDSKYASELPMKTILDLAVEYGYIDTNDSTNTNQEVRRERAELKRKSKSSQRGRGQYPVVRNIYQTDEYGAKDFSKIIGTETEWITSKDQDKSGYSLNPDKYIKLLDTVGLDNYSTRLDAYYNKIENLRIRILTLMNKLTLDSTANDNNAFSEISSAIYELGRAIDRYQRLKQNIEEIIQQGNVKDDYPMEERISDEFRWDIKYVRDSLNDTIDVVKKLESKFAE